MTVFWIVALSGADHGGGGFVPPRIFGGGSFPQIFHSCCWFGPPRIFEGGMIPPDFHSCSWFCPKCKADCNVPTSLWFAWLPQQLQSPKKNFLATLEERQKKFSSLCSKRGKKNFPRYARRKAKKIFLATLEERKNNKFFSSLCLETGNTFFSSLLSETSKIHSSATN